MESFISIAEAPVLNGKHAKEEDNASNKRPTDGMVTVTNIC